MNKNSKSYRILSVASLRVFATLLAFLTISAASHAQEQKTGDSSGKRIDLLRDSRFQNGFQVGAPAAGTFDVTGLIQGSAPAGEPAWRLVQWNSKYDLSTAQPVSMDENTVRYANEAKTVVLTSGNRYNDLILSLDSRPEYGGRMRMNNDRWPHLLIEQDVPSYLFKDVSRIDFAIEARLLKNDREQLEGYSRTLHSAQFTLTFIIQNRNRHSPGFGDFIWFGVAMYDERKEFCDVYAAMDTADPSAKMIYCPAIREFSDETLHAGHWVTFSHTNLCRLFQVAFGVARQKGYLKASSDVGDFAISSVIVGWEVTGVNNASMQIRNLNVRIYID